MGEIDPGVGAFIMFVLLGALMFVVLYAGTHGRGK
jgi:hypothetical protein